MKRLLSDLLPNVDAFLTHPYRFISVIVIVSWLLICICVVAVL